MLVQSKSGKHSCCWGLFSLKQTWNNQERTVYFHRENRAFSNTTSRRAPPGLWLKCEKRNTRRETAICLVILSWVTEKEAGLKLYRIRADVLKETQLGHLWWNCRILPEPAFSSLLPNYPSWETQNRATPMLHRINALQAQFKRSTINWLITTF